MLPMTAKVTKMKWNCLLEELMAANMFEQTIYADDDLQDDIADDHEADQTEENDTAMGFGRVLEPSFMYNNFSKRGVALENLLDKQYQYIVGIDSGAKYMFACCQLEMYPPPLSPSLISSTKNTSFRETTFKISSKVYHKRSHFETFQRMCAEVVGATFMQQQERLRDVHTIISDENKLEVPSNMSDNYLNYVRYKLNTFTAKCNAWMDIRLYAKYRFV